MESQTIIKPIDQPEGSSLVLADMNNGGHIIEPAVNFVTLGVKFSKEGKTSGSYINVPKSHLPALIEAVQEFINNNK